MTGEITLRGNVLPVGGVKEKVLAARRARVNKIILPYRNERDLDDVPKELFKDIKFVFVDHIRQVFEVALKEKIETVVAKKTSIGNGKEKNTTAKKSEIREKTTRIQPSQSVN
jgi:ATP-dependent Lon protease